MTKEEMKKIYHKAIEAAKNTTDMDSFYGVFIGALLCGLGLECKDFVEAAISTRRELEKNDSISRSKK